MREITVNLFIFFCIWLRYCFLYARDAQQTYKKDVSKLSLNFIKKFCRGKKNKSRHHFREESLYRGRYSKHLENAEI